MPDWADFEKPFKSEDEYEKHNSSIKKIVKPKLEDCLSKATK